MKKNLFLLLLLFPNLLISQIKSPEVFLGYPIGTQFTYHHKIVEYAKHLANSKPERVSWVSYGQTNEGRELGQLIITNQNNINRLQAIRQKHQDVLQGKINDRISLDELPLIINLSFNVHGNEASGSEASLSFLYDLVTNDSLFKTKTSFVILVDPCINPDGREAYVTQFKRRNYFASGNEDPFDQEHFEGNVSGRYNHYSFDLNRDWIWQTQVETKQRMEFFQSWLPMVHADFHEQSYQHSYYFPPAAKPYLNFISNSTKDLQESIGVSFARLFDSNNWNYFTREIYDLYYPGYGDTYPIYNGSVGMTFEQGGSGRAGLAIITAEGDTLTLKDRIDHHFTSGLSTVEASSKYADRALSEFSNYFVKSKTSPPGEYKSYILRGDNPEKLKTLSTLLKRNGIDFGYGASKSVQAFNYFTGKNESVKVSKSDMVISAYQAKSVLLKVLFEPNTFVSDSATYDITSWSLPYAHGIQAFASKESLNPLLSSPERETKSINKVENSTAYVANWSSVTDVKFLGDLLKRNIKVRFSEIAFESAGNRFDAGSLIITRNGNLALGANFENVIYDLAKKNGIDLIPMASGFVDKGADLGSDKVRLIKKPKVVVIGGEATSSLAFGEIWHFFEQQINYPVSIVRSQDLNRIDWSEINVLILPSGNYADLSNEKLIQWVRGGGKLIAMGNAVSQLAEVKGFDIKVKEEAKKDEKGLDPYKFIKTYENRERESILNNTPGAIYKIDLDNSHPLGFGFPNFYYSLKLDDQVYQYLNEGWNVGVVKKNNYVTGFVGAEAKKKTVDGLIFGVQELGSGSVVYLGDDPLFRSFWESGKLLFSNAVFMVGN